MFSIKPLICMGYWPWVVPFFRTQVAFIPQSTQVSASGWVGFVPVGSVPVNSGPVGIMGGRRSIRPVTRTRIKIVAALTVMNRRVQPILLRCLKTVIFRFCFAHWARMEPSTLGVAASKASRIFSSICLFVMVSILLFQLVFQLLNGTVVLGQHGGQGHIQHRRDLPVLKAGYRMEHHHLPLLIG